jgi:hypothetical protein
MTALTIERNRMDENDNTVQPDAQAAPELGQPASDVAEPETLDTTDTSEPSDAPQASEESPAAPDVDEQLQKFAQSQGIELDSPNAIKAAQALQKARGEATRNYQKASQLEQGMTEMSDASAEQVAGATGQDPEVLKRLQRMEVKSSVRDFFDSTPDARQYEARMTEIAQTAGLYGTPEAILKAAYGMALAENVAGNADRLKAEGARERLQSMAHKQQAAVPTGHATTQTSPKEKSVNDMSPEEIKAKYGSVRR